MFSKALTFFAALLCVASLLVLIPGPLLLTFVIHVAATELWPILAFANIIVCVTSLLLPRDRWRGFTLGVSGIALLCSLTPIVAYVAEGPRVPLAALLTWPSTRGVSAAHYVNPRMVIYQRAPRSSNRPIIIAIYGGAWARGSPDRDARLNEELASINYLVIAIDYRHAPGAKWPAQRDDVESAVTWVRAHARSLGGDPARIALLGHSSGAQLALAAAARTPLVRAVITYESPVDLELGYRYPSEPDIIHARLVMRNLCGGPPESTPRCYRDASPRFFVHSGMPPVLMLVARHDHIVDRRFEQILRNRLQADGVRVTFIELAWAEHAFETIPDGWHNRIAFWFIRKFLEREFRRVPTLPGAHRRSFSRLRPGYAKLP